MPVGDGEREEKFSLSLCPRMASMAHVETGQNCKVSTADCLASVNGKEPGLTSFPSWAQGCTPKSCCRSTEQRKTTSVTPKCNVPWSPGSGLYTQRAKPGSLHQRAEIPCLLSLKKSPWRLSLMAESNNCYCLSRTGLG